MFRFLRSLLGDRARPAPEPLDPRQLEFLEGLRQDSVLLVGSPTPTGSFLGGRPQLADGTPWPEREGRALEFVLQLDLEAVARVHAVDWMPEGGRLLFFYDDQEQPWGFDPKDRGSWAVLWQEGAAAASQGQARFTQRYLSCRPVKVLADPDELELGSLELSAGQLLTVAQLSDAAADPDSPRHRVFGPSEPIQGADMALECQLASNGVYLGDGEDSAEPRAAALAAGATDWRLLLQLDTDDDAAMMWGDCGRLYVWVREQDARAHRFDDAWVILQCS